jgi:hypothetical protein
VSVVPALLGGVLARLVPVVGRDSQQIWPFRRALPRTCPFDRRHRPGPPAGLIRSLSALARDSSQICRSVTPTQAGADTTRVLERRPEPHAHGCRTCRRRRP